MVYPSVFLFCVTIHFFSVGVFWVRFHIYLKMHHPAHISKRILGLAKWWYAGGRNRVTGTHTHTHTHIHIYVCICTYVHVYLSIYCYIGTCSGSSLYKSNKTNIPTFYIRAAVWVWRSDLYRPMQNDQEKARTLGRTQCIVWALQSQPKVTKLYIVIL